MVGALLLHLLGYDFPLGAIWHEFKSDVRCVAY